MAAELHLVEGGKPKPARKPAAGRNPKPLTLEQAIAVGDKPAELRAHRLLLAKRMSGEKVTAAALAAMSRRLQELGDELDELEGRKKSAPPTTEGSPESEPVPDEPWTGEF